MENPNITVELSAYEAASIVAYLKSFVFYEGETMQGCRTSIDALTGQIAEQWTDEHNTEARRETKIKQALGFEP